jgi:hypothetical protein
LLAAAICSWIFDRAKAICTLKYPRSTLNRRPPFNLARAHVAAAAWLVDGNEGCAWHVPQWVWSPVPVQEPEPEETGWVLA